MSTPDELRAMHQRLLNDDDLRQRVTQRIRCETRELDGSWYAVWARVRVAENHVTSFEPPTEAFPTREEAEDFARAYALHRLQDTAE